MQRKTQTEKNKMIWDNIINSGCGFNKIAAL